MLFYRLFPLGYQSLFQVRFYDIDDHLLEPLRKNSVSCGKG